MNDALMTGGELGRRYTACLGGWCSVRESCPHYTTDDRRDPAERLCEPGQDGEAVQIRRFKPIGSWERGSKALLAPAGVFDGLVA